ncbi:MAG TPA: molybdenum cofactor guanylyltransferase, partial [Vicinamibacteria bacterium]|nr:molybdenum cofactor guanylyltransferase [Vicinamibacteria bacterium]
AGGRSRRMGRDKALLPWGPATLLDHALARLREACGEVAILCGPQPRYAERGVPILTDVVAGAGPLAGLVTALEADASDLALLLAVDVPFAPVSLLRYLLQRCQGADAAVPFTGGRPHPLCAVYRRTCLDAARRRLAAGDLKMTAFWPDVRVVEVREPELSPFGDPDVLLRNLNTLKDYEAARAADG